MGAFAGSAALFCGAKTDKVSVITLTINNKCNLKCPHCYLQYDGTDKEIAQHTLEALWSSGADTLSIVGMEPLVNRESVTRLRNLASEAKNHGMRVGFITNGLNAHLLDRSTAETVDWIDISIDGTEETYESFRGTSFAKLEKSIATILAMGTKTVNFLQTINTKNISEMSKMASTAQKLGASQTVMSPFCKTRHQGRQDDLAISAEDFMSECYNAYGNLSNCWLIMDTAWLPSEVGYSEYCQKLAQLFQNRAIIFEDDPIAYGMVRVTYEGQIMTPRQAMHTSDYSSMAYNTRDHSIQAFNNIYQRSKTPSTAIAA